VVDLRVIGSTNPIWIDADGDNKFTAARDYAATLVRRSNGDAERLRAALDGYDAAVALHAAELARVENR
jgi:hypothetical protein